MIEMLRKIMAELSGIAFGENKNVTLKRKNVKRLGKTANPEMEADTLG